MLLFRPETDLYSDKQENKYRYYWSEFVAFVKKIDDKKGPEIDAMRYDHMKTMARGWKTCPKVRAILKSYRNRNRTIWTDDERRHHNRMLGKVKSRSRREWDDLDLIRNIHEAVNDRPQLEAGTQRRILNQVAQGNKIADCMREFGKSLPDSEAEVPDKIATPAEKNTERESCRCSVPTADSFPQLAETIKTAKPVRKLSEAPGPKSSEQATSIRSVL